MTNQSNRRDELIPTTIRVSTMTLKVLDEASSLQQITRADLIRLSLQETVDRWKGHQRRRVLERLGATI